MYVIGYRQIYALTATKSSAPNPIPIAKGAESNNIKCGHLIHLFLTSWEYGSEGYMQSSIQVMNAASTVIYFLE